MAKSVSGDPKLDAAAKKAFKAIDDTFYASNQFKASNLKNYDIEILKRMNDISRDFTLAAKYITVRLEQSDGAQKAQINTLEKRVGELETATYKAPVAKAVKAKPAKKLVAKKPKPVAKPAPKPAPKPVVKAEQPVQSPVPVAETVTA